ncbi:MAG: PEP-CTERM sorting domain-containing protein [Aquabacterium sp.]
MLKHARLALMSAALLPLLAQAASVTVDAGHFAATYDTAAFSSGWGAGQYDGYNQQASQYLVTTGPDSLRIDIAQLPPGTNSYHQGESTLLYATGAANYIASVYFRLPLTLAADAPDTTAYRVTIGTHLSGTGYTPFNGSSSYVTGSLTATDASATTFTLAPVDASVPSTGIATPAAMTYSGVIGAGTSLASIDGAFKLYGAYSKPCCGSSLTFGIDYIQIDALTVSSSVPEPGSLALMGLGLAGLGWARRRQLRGI